MSAQASQQLVSTNSGRHTARKTRRQRKRGRSKATRAPTLEIKSTPEAAGETPAPVRSEDVELGDLELTFFEASPRVAALPLPIEDDPHATKLTPAELDRRLRLRKHVARVVSGLGLFSMTTAAIQLTYIL